MRQSIFIVDDNPWLVEALVLYIENEVDLVVCGTAATALEALDAIPGEQPDLVIADLSLPDIDGVEFIVRLHRLIPSQRTVLYTGHPRSDYEEQAQAAGVNACSQKGDSDSLLRVIRKVLDGRTV